MNKNSEGPRIGQMGYEIKASRPCHQKKNKKMDLNISDRNVGWGEHYLLRLISRWKFIGLYGYF